MAATSLNTETAINDSRATRFLLTCGIVAGPWFIGMSLIQAFTRQGFNLTRHTISQLLLGDLGWIQLITFIATGLLAFAYAIGIRRLLYPGRGGTWGPILVGIYAIGFMIAGLFPPDPAFGFPSGAPDGINSTPSGHANVHALAFLVLVISLIASCFVFARRFSSLGQRGWGAYCIAIGLAVPILFVLGAALTPGGNGGLPLLGVALVTSAGLSAVAARLAAELNLEISRKTGIT